MKPTSQYEDRPGDESRDFAAAGSFSLFALERMLRDCKEQPNWRLRASVCAAYYDGKQFTPEQQYMIRSEGLEERAINLIRPIINSVLGQEAKSRTDVKVEADDDSYTDVAEVVSMRLKEAERETRAHMAVSEGYASGVKKGLGWAHVTKNSDPLAYPYRVEAVPIDEIWWDWKGQRGPTLLDGCRWLVRARFIDLDELEAAMPQFKAVLRLSASGWDNYLDNMGSILGEPEDLMLSSGYENELRFSLTVNKMDWLDSARKMIKMYEVWYRVPASCVVLHLSPTKRVVYDPKDPRHVEAVARGLVKVTKGITSQVRRALYAGPHRLLDEGTDKRNFPYIPFFAFRDDEDKSPYGLIDGMVAPQDEYNERRLRIQWMLKARQVQMDSDALDTKYNTISDIADAIMRPDLVAITDPNRTNKNQSAILVKNDLSMQREQFDVMADSKQLIQDTAGRYSSQLGSNPAGVTSGVANSMLIEQGEQSMGEMNDNYTYFRRSVFEALVSEIVSDYTAEKMQVPIGSGKTRRVVVLNDWDANGMPLKSGERRGNQDVTGRNTQHAGIPSTDSTADCHHHPGAGQQPAGDRDSGTGLHGKHGTEQPPADCRRLAQGIRPANAGRQERPGPSRPDAATDAPAKAATGERSRRRGDRCPRGPGRTEPCSRPPSQRECRADRTTHCGRRSPGRSE